MTAISRLEIWGDDIRHDTYAGRRVRRSSVLARLFPSHDACGLEQTRLRGGLSANDIPVLIVRNGWFVDAHRCAMMDGMPKLARTTAGLRIFGDTLDPDEITHMLGVEPTSCGRKGETRRTVSGREVTARCGVWLLEAEASADLNTQIDSLLAKLPSATSIWRELTRRYACDVFCGLFMRASNEGTELQPQVLSMLSDRGLRLGLDIYNLAD